MWSLELPKLQLSLPLFLRLEFPMTKSRLFQNGDGISRSVDDSIAAMKTPPPRTIILISGGKIIEPSNPTTPKLHLHHALQLVVCQCYLFAWSAHLVHPLPTIKKHPTSLFSSNKPNAKQPHCHHRSFMSCIFLNRVDWGFVVTFSSFLDHVYGQIRCLWRRPRFISFWIGVWITLISQLLFLTSMGLFKDHWCCLWMVELWDNVTITLIDKPIIGILLIWWEWMNCDVK